MDALDRRIYETARTCEYYVELYRRRGLRLRRAGSFAQLVVTATTVATSLHILSNSGAGVSEAWQAALGIGALAAGIETVFRPGVAAAAAESLAARWAMLMGDALQLEIEGSISELTLEEKRSRVIRLRSQMNGLGQEDLLPQPTKESLTIQNLIEARQGLEPVE